MSPTGQSTTDVGFRHALRSVRQHRSPGQHRGEQLGPKARSTAVGSSTTMLDLPTTRGLKARRALGVIATAVL